MLSRFDGAHWQSEVNLFLFACRFDFIHIFGLINMKREASPGEGKPESEEHVPKKGKASPTTDKTLGSELNLEDLGAGYSVEDKRVARAILQYETKLLPFINENYSVFKNSNFLSLRGYATGCKST